MFSIVFHIECNKCDHTSTSNRVVDTERKISDDDHDNACSVASKICTVCIEGLTKIYYQIQLIVHLISLHDLYSHHLTGY